MSGAVPDERGAVSTFLAVIALAMLMAAGLAIDGGRKINALLEASHLADNAARAGAQAVDLDTLRTTGDLRLLPEEAAARVDQYLTSLGHTGEITVVGDTVTVTVSLTVDPVLLPMGPITVTATETAAAITLEP
ncbi:MAG: Tad domain-containing protein [Acidobacteria bacterium]|nr:Tad domain-containing protein [Acidobacteriota bacterium]